MDINYKEGDPCDHLGFKHVDVDDPGNENGVFGKAVCPRCWGSGKVFNPYK